MWESGGCSPRIIPSVTKVSSGRRRRARHRAITPSPPNLARAAWPKPNGAPPAAEDSYAAASAPDRAAGSRRSALPPPAGREKSRLLREKLCLWVVFVPFVSWSALESVDCRVAVLGPFFAVSRVRFNARSVGFVANGRWQKPKAWEIWARISPCLKLNYFYKKHKYTPWSFYWRFSFILFFNAVPNNKFWNV
jgi:hypothetical protein